MPIHDEHEPISGLSVVMADRKKQLYWTGFLEGILASGNIERLEPEAILAEAEKFRTVFGTDSDHMALLADVGSMTSINIERRHEERLQFHINARLERLSDESEWLDQLTDRDEINRFLGYCAGILSDGEVMASEARAIQLRLGAKSVLRESAIFAPPLKSALDLALADGAFTADEASEILEWLTQLVGPGYADTGEGSIGHVAHFDTLIEDPNEIQLDGARVVLTGPMRLWPRGAIIAAIQDCGGRCTDTVSALTDYVVLSDTASRLWLTSHYGTKIRDAKLLIDDGAPIRFVAEAALAEAIADSRAAIAEANDGMDRDFSEDDTIDHMIRPVLRALGWVRPTELRRTYGTRSRKFADLACRIANKPVTIVEAKKLGERIDSEERIHQAIQYGTDEGADWCVLTDGREWAICNAHASEPLKGKLFRRFDIADESMTEFAVATLRLLSKTAMQAAERPIDLAWDQEYTDRRVERTLTELLASGDARLGELLRQAIPKGRNIPEADLRAAMAKFLVGTDVPVSITAPAPAPRQEAPTPVAEATPLEAPTTEPEPEILRPEAAATSPAPTPAPTTAENLRKSTIRRRRYDGSWPAEATHVICRDDCLAFGRYEEGGGANGADPTMTVLAGARLSRVEMADNIATVRRHRDRLLGDGTLVRDGAHLRLTVETTWSVSRAAKLVMGVSADGYDDWRAPDDRTLDETARAGDATEA